MIRLTDILKEANPKADFLKAISGIKPAEVYRIHAKLPNGKVGITAWYTKATIDDLEDEIKSTGATIIKIEKSTKDADIKENKMIKLKDLLNELDIVTEIEFDSQEELDDYKKKHKVRKGTVLKVRSTKQCSVVKPWVRILATGLPD